MQNGTPWFEKLADAVKQKKELQAEADKALAHRMVAFHAVVWPKLMERMPTGMLEGGNGITFDLESEGASGIKVSVGNSWVCVRQGEARLSSRTYCKVGEGDGELVSRGEYYLGPNENTNSSFEVVARALEALLSSEGEEQWKKFTSREIADTAQR